MNKKGLFIQIILRISFESMGELKISFSKKKMPDSQRIKGFLQDSGIKK